MRETHALRDVLRRFLDETSSLETVLALMETGSGFDPGVWRRLGTELGLLDLVVSDADDGSAVGFGTVAVVFEEMGRTLFCGPFLGSATVATLLLTSCGRPDVQERLLPAMADGSVIAAAAITADAGLWRRDAVVVQATQVDGAWCLDGTCDLVLDGLLAGVLLVAARYKGRILLFETDPRDPGIERELRPTLDRTRKLARVSLRAAPARLIGPQEADLWPHIERVGDLALVALAAEQLGAAARCLQLSLEHARTRVQFGRPIGSFQAVKHRCADVHMRIEAARSALNHAVEAAAAGAHDELALMASLLKSYCSALSVDAAKSMLQIHGGIGFTWRHPTHLFLKRAKSSELMFGTPQAHRERIGRMVGI